MTAFSPSIVLPIDHFDGHPFEQSTNHIPETKPLNIKLRLIR